MLTFTKFQKMSNENLMAKPNSREGIEAITERLRWHDGQNLKNMTVNEDARCNRTMLKVNKGEISD